MIWGIIIGLFVGYWIRPYTKVVFKVSSGKRIPEVPFDVAEAERAKAIGIASAKDIVQRGPFTVHMVTPFYGGRSGNPTGFQYLLEQQHGGARHNWRNPDPWAKIKQGDIIYLTVNEGLRSERFCNNASPWRYLGLGSVDYS